MVYKYKNKEKEYMKKYRENHKEYFKNYRKKYRLENRELIYTKNKKWYEKNKEIIKKRIYKNKVKKLKTDPIFKLSENLRGRIYKAIKSKNAKKNKHYNEYIGCSIDEFRQYLEKQFKPGMSWANYGTWHVDHIKPCSLFNLNELEEQIKCFHYSNLQPLWAYENLKKSDNFE